MSMTALSPRIGSVKLRARKGTLTGAGRLIVMCFIFMMNVFTTCRTLAMSQSDANALAFSLLTQSGRHCAIIAVPHCGSGELAMGFWNEASQSNLLVDAFENDPTLLTSAQQKANALGLLGRNLYVRSGSLTANAYSLPYADHFCDLVCMTGLADTNFNNISYAEVERVLCTGAKAWIGRAAVEGAGLSMGTLTNWVNAAGTRALSSATVTNDGNGTWAVITKISRLPNTYEGSGKKTSAGDYFYNDKVATWPTLPQWFVKPYGNIRPDGKLPPGYLRSGKWGELATPCAGGGRVYGFDGANLCALRAYNGQLLWQRAGLSGTLQAFSKGVVCGTNVIEGETGTNNATILLSGSVTWSAVDNRPAAQGDRNVVINLSTPSGTAVYALGSVTTHTLKITDKEANIATQPSSQTVSWGQPARFSVGATGVGLFYQWRREGVGNISGATNASYTTPPTVVADNGAVFSVIVSNAFSYVTSTYALLTVSQIPQVCSLGVQANQLFGFSFTGPIHATIVVETCTSLINAVWIPVSTQTLTGGTCTFNDPTSTNRPVGFYRFREL